MEEFVGNAPGEVFLVDVVIGLVELLELFAVVVKGLGHLVDEFVRQVPVCDDDRDPGGDRDRLGQGLVKSGRKRVGDVAATLLAEFCKEILAG